MLTVGIKLPTTIDISIGTNPMIVPQNIKDMPLVFSSLDAFL